jgi:hypothetical protein
MFEKLKEKLRQMQMMRRLMKDENFKAFISHPKVKALFRDPEFKEVAGARNFDRIAAHPKFIKITKDPEVAALLIRINPKTLQF